MERRLAAILAADVVGYARPIRNDEEGTKRPDRGDGVNRRALPVQGPADGRGLAGTLLRRFGQSAGRRDNSSEGGCHDHVRATAPHPS